MAINASWVDKMSYHGKDNAGRMHAEKYDDSNEDSFVNRLKAFQAGSNPVLEGTMVENLERKVQALDEIMDMLVEQNAELKELLAAKRARAQSEIRSCPTPIQSDSESCSSHSESGSSESELDCSTRIC